MFPAQGVPFVPLAADLQEAAPGALGLPEGSLRELIVLEPSYYHIVVGLRGRAPLLRRRLLKY